MLHNVPESATMLYCPPHAEPGKCCTVGTSTPGMLWQVQAHPFVPVSGKMWVTLVPGVKGYSSCKSGVLHFTPLSVCRITNFIILSMVSPLMFTICCLETHMDYLVDVHTLFSNIFLVNRPCCMLWVCPHRYVLIQVSEWC